MPKVQDTSCKLAIGLQIATYHCNYRIVILVHAPRRAVSTSLVCVQTLTSDQYVNILHCALILPVTMVVIVQTLSHLKAHFVHVIVQESSLVKIVKSTPCLPTLAKIMDHMLYCAVVHLTLLVIATCSLNIDDCISDPCLNGANCTDMINGFMCDCPAGFSGQQCHIDNDECSTNPCANGRCVDMIADYLCECNFGFTGRNCEINIDNCIANACLNNGTCVDDIESFYCDCPQGFGGSRCETESTCELQQDTCQNSGLCNVSSGLQISCQCMDGFTGSLCETEIRR